MELAEPEAARREARERHGDHLPVAARHVPVDHRQCSSGVPSRMLNEGPCGLELVNVAGVLRRRARAEDDLTAWASIGSACTVGGRAARHPWTAAQPSASIAPPIRSTSSGPRRRRGGDFGQPTAAACSSSGGAAIRMGDRIVRVELDR